MDRMVEIPDTRASRGRGTSNGVADGSNVVLGVRDSLTGTLVVEGNVRILGSVEGEVRATGDIDIDSSANVQARIEGRSINVRGDLTGDVVAHNRFTVGGSGTVTGDVRAPRLQVDDGETAGCICRRFTGGVGPRVADRHAGTGSDRFGLVCDDAADGAFSIRLRRDASRGTEQDSEQADRAKARRSSQIHHRDLHMLETRNILDRRCCDDAKNRRPRATRRTITVRYGQAPIHRER